MDTNILKEVKFNGDGLVPAVIQDYQTGEVLMVAYMNRESLEKSVETGKTHFWSRSRQKLWLKGETSGHFQNIRSIHVDCDSDTLLFKVEQTGAACHTGNYSCFFREVELSGAQGENPAQPEDGEAPKNRILQELYDIISDRKLHPKEGSYTNYLFEKGIDKILKKVGEESAEVIIAAKNRSSEEVRYETADLIYHLMVLLVDQGLKLDDIYDELKGRR